MNRYQTQEFIDNKTVLKSSHLTHIEDGITNIEDILYKDVVTEGYFDISYDMINGITYRITGEEIPYEAYHRTDFIAVTPGEKYKVKCALGSKVIPGIVLFGKEKNFLGYIQPGTGTLIEYDLDYTVPEDDTVAFIVVQNNASAMSSLSITKYKYEKNTEVNCATKDYVAERITSLAGARYGVRWNLDNPDDLGERVFDAVGLTASIGLGSQDGYSDFDTIYPWSAMKRCNIRKNSNGATLVTYEGEEGFALDGSNGDVFVRIPKFYYERFVDPITRYEYRIISQGAAVPHPAFVEDGIELNEIFISAFEGTIIDSKMHSYADKLPAMNHTLAEFLTYATNNGVEYSLYDSRCVDLVFTLMSIEYGCRNSNRIIGYGIADYYQAIYGSNGLNCILAAENTNVVRTQNKGNPKKFIHPGDAICVCGNQKQSDILTHAICTKMEFAPDDSYVEFTFDGDPINVDLNSFVGTGPQITNWCETCNGPLNWHTGRAQMIHDYEVRQENIYNPCRYRWIENPVGNAWHFLPDVTFKDCQMYVCHNMREYKAHSYDAPYEPIGDILPNIGKDNGNKGDVTGANYWITELGQYDFAKGISFGKKYNKELLSTKAFGAFYYLSGGVNAITNGGGFDHLWRCNVLTNRAWQGPNEKWYLYGARIMYKHIKDQ